MRQSQKVSQCKNPKLMKLPNPLNLLNQLKTSTRWMFLLKMHRVHSLPIPTFQGIMLLQRAPCIDMP